MMNRIKEYISGKGYTCREGLVEGFLLSLKSRPFTLLCGHSATDMTVLPRLFAEAVGAKFLCLQVRPDWQDSSDLFGHLDLMGNFVPGPVIDYLKQAQNDPQRPYFLCFDGVLLDRAEYYLREILAAVESRETDAPLPMVTMAYYGRDAAAGEKYGQIPPLDNLYFIGTVNMDEASKPVNQKLLDRVHAMAYETDALVRTGEDTCPVATPMDNAYLQTVYFRLEQCEQDALLPYFARFEQLNKILMKANAYMGYKLRNDAVLYLMHGQRMGLPEEQTLDHVIAHKLLTRVQGSAKTTQPVLEALLTACAQYPYTEKKIRRMLRQCEKDGYCGFYEEECLC